MKKQLRGFSKIFSFTFKQHARSKGYKNSTIMIGLLCLILPAAIMIGISVMSDDKAPAETAAEQQYDSIGRVKQIYAVDLSEDRKVDVSALGQMLLQIGVNAEIKDYGGDFDSARADSAGSDDVLVLVTEQKDSEYNIYTVVPENSGLSQDAADAFGGVVASYGEALNQIEDASGKNEAEDGDSGYEMKQIMTMVFSMLNAMVLYFFVLAYGQGVANSVVMEKSSKLMENFLISVKPAAIILGKLLAITSTGILQLFSWILGLTVSFAAGTFVVKTMEPDTDMMIIQVFRLVKNAAEGMFSPLNCVIALLMLMAGMLLYCALAGIGGAIASKAEDLSSSSVIFSLVVVASFLATLYCGDFSGTQGSGEFLNWIPFTAVFITPAKVLMGEIALWETLASFAAIIAATILITLAAGKIYRALALYRGELLKPKNLIKMLRS